MPELSKVIKYLFLFLTVAFITIILVFTSRNINAINSNIYLYAFTAIFPLLCSFIYILQKRSIVSNPINIRVATAIIVGFFFILCLRYVYTLLDAAGMVLVGYIMNILVFLSVVVGLAIIYRSSVDYLLKIGGYSRFFVLAIFYVPCLLINLIKYINHELRITSKITYILFFIELILLIGYFYFSQIFQKDFLLQGGEMILEEKQFLDTKKILSLSGHNKQTDQDEEQINLRTQYSLSLWIYVNTPEFSSSIFPIICYGNDNNPKPKITYGYDKESKQYVFSIYFSDLHKVIKLQLPSQRWNHFVFNYNGSIVDLFVNGILDRSMDLKDNMPIFNISDSFIIGSDKKGIYGVISKIVYYTRTLTSFEILGLYRLGITTIDL